MTAEQFESGEVIMKRFLVLMFLVCMPFFAACSRDKVNPPGSNGIERGSIAGSVAGDGGKEGETMKSTTGRVLRTAHGGGRWFPGESKRLGAMVNDFIKRADVPEVKGRIIGAIAPHAGYVYSGKVAGYTFKAIQDNAARVKAPETVVVLGFSHRMGFRGVALMDGDALVTPMGEAQIDMEATRLLAASSKRIIVDYSLHGEEHSAENEVPFVQAALPGVKIVVGLFGDHDGQSLNDLVMALSELAKKKRILVIASTDMLHDVNYELVAKTDKITLEKLAAMDMDGLIKAWSMDKQIFCGLMPVLAVMKFAGLQGCKTAEVLHYRNSGDDFPESRGNWVVGYGAAVFAVHE